MDRPTGGWRLGIVVGFPLMLYASITCVLMGLLSLPPGASIMTALLLSLVGALVLIYLLKGETLKSFIVFIHGVLLAGSFAAGLLVVSHSAVGSLAYTRAFWADVFASFVLSFYLAKIILVTILMLWYRDLREFFLWCTREDLSHARQFILRGKSLWLGMFPNRKNDYAMVQAEDFGMDWPDPKTLGRILSTGLPFVIFFGLGMIKSLTVMPYFKITLFTAAVTIVFLFLNKVPDRRVDIYLSLMVLTIAATLIVPSLRHYTQLPFIGLALLLFSRLYSLPTRLD